MKNEKKDKILLHARNLQWLIIVYTVIFLSRFLLSFGFPELYEQHIGDNFPVLYITALGLPITGYAIWYVLNVAPLREGSKTSKVLGLLFFGIIGMWMTFPILNKVKDQLERKNSRVSIGW